MRNTLQSRLYSVHTYLLPIYYVIYELFKNYKLKSELTIKETILYITLTLLFSITTNYLFVFFTKTKYKASLYSSILFCIIFFFITWVDIALSNPFISYIVSSINLHKKIVIFGFLALLYIIFLASTWKKTIEFKNLSFYLSLLVVSFTILELVNIANFKPNDIKLLNNFNPKNNLKSEYPDIYYIILDSYSSNERLSKYGHNNAYFTEFLKGKGFYLSTNSNSNYNYTSSSLSSSLNSSYLNIKNKGRYSMLDIRKLSEFINNNRVVNTLKKVDYQTNIFSLYSISDEPSRLLNLPEDKLGGSKSFFATLLRFYYQTFDSNNQISLNKAYYNYNIKSFNYLDSLSTSNASEKPQFNYIHILATHPPFVINSKGDFEEKLNLTHNKDSYIREIEYTNDRIMSFVKTLLKSKQKQPVIIIQSDHGAHLNNLAETKTILNAYYFPDKNYESLYQTISPVNTFRVIFNKYFDSKLQLLPDSSYYVNYP